MGCILAFVYSYLSLWKGFRWVREAECTPPFACGAGPRVFDVCGERKASDEMGRFQSIAILENRVLVCLLALGGTMMAKGKTVGSDVLGAPEAKMVSADGTGNLSKQRREDLVMKLGSIRSFLEKSAAVDTNAVQLLCFAAELEKEVRTKKYGLVFEEHKERVDVELEHNLPVLTEDKKRFIDNGGEVNFLIEGDNLAALKLLEKTHRCRIDLIYIDPPYNTGNKDFVYNDSYVDATDTFRHSKWLSFMKKRLESMRILMSREGFICISIDDNELSALRMMCDQMFGDENFVACMPRRTKSSGKTTKDVSQNHDYLLIYARDSSCLAMGGLPHVDEGFKFSDEFEKERGKFKLNQTLDYDSLQYSQSLDYPLEIEGEIFYPGQSKSEWKKRQRGDHKRADWEWRWSKEKFDFGYRNGFVVVKRKSDGTARIYTKTYLNASIEPKNGGGYEVVIMQRDKPLSTLDFMAKEFSNDNAKKELKDIFGDCPFDYPKPMILIESLLGVSLKTNAVVLDCFAGSGTTGHAVLKVNAENEKCHRKFILVTNNENGICEKVTYERLKRVIEKEDYAARLKYYKIGYVPIDEKVYYEYANDLLKHIRELVELENAVDFSKDKTVAIALTDKELEKFVGNDKRLEACKAVYVGHDVLISSAIKATLKKHGVKVNIIPQYYYPELEG